MTREDINARLENAAHLIQEIRNTETVLDELFFSRPTISVAPPPVNFFSGSVQYSLATSDGDTSVDKNMDNGLGTLTATLTSPMEHGPVNYPENFGEIIGQRIRVSRLTAGITQNELADKTGIKRPNIARLEKGLSLPNLSTLVKVSSALQIPLYSLLNTNF
ncbi:MAG: helix-turn-helix transcriptional regulator [Deltaproteobacteria bacterium]|nr:helix-turn-helix transcriptional regulator [Deltaproteobacteria bacterium]